MSKVVYLNSHLKKFNKKSEIKVELEDLRGDHSCNELLLEVLISAIIVPKNANVIPIILKQKFKKGSFYCPFFLSELKNGITE